MCSDILRLGCTWVWQEGTPFYLQPQAALGHDLSPQLADASTQGSLPPPHPSDLHTQVATSRLGVFVTVALQLVAWTSRPGVTVGSGTSSSGIRGLTGRQLWQAARFLITYVIVTLRHHCYKPSGRATRLYNSDYCACVDATTHSGTVNAIKLVKP